MNKFNEIKKRISNLLQNLPSGIDRSWLVSSYLSLKQSFEMKYQKDFFLEIERNKQNIVLEEINSLDFEGTSNENKFFVAGFYFNNSVFRIVALAEIGLKVLFEKKMKLPAIKRDYKWLKEWYEKTFNKKMDNIQSARKRVNVFKHEPRSVNLQKKFETIEDGIAALEELLLLLEKIIEIKA
jgi:hypothetical protein